ncbi:uncharacterized protein LOC134274955 [Saccostrea cucullata]|uniref:uncharacterized protein LOC134274955 n=1 Tax=Saccostrea cuccullata TaxID=36930 RepID=UPI002ED58250
MVSVQFFAFLLCAFYLTNHTMASERRLEQLALALFKMQENQRVLETTISDQDKRIKNLEDSVEKCMNGRSHTPEEDRDASSNSDFDPPRYKPNNSVLYEEIVDQAKQQVSKSADAGLQRRLSGTNGYVAFFARMTHHEYKPGSLHIYVFDSATTNIGGHYNVF